MHFEGLNGKRGVGGGVTGRVSDEYKSPFSIESVICE